MNRKAAVFIAAAMAIKLNLLLLTIVFLSSILCCRGENEELIKTVRNVFFSKPLNMTDREKVLKNARESFLFLKCVETWSETEEKLNFAKNYANFLSELFELLKTKPVDVQELFSKENSFLKDYIENPAGEQVNATEVQVVIRDFQIAAEQLLGPYCNSSSELYDAAEILNLESSSFDAFLKEKLRSDYSEVGYFFLEVFATLIGLSWGIISTIIHITENMGGQ